MKEFTELSLLCAEEGRAGPAVAPAATCSSYFVATVEWIRGNRPVSTVMRNAGLGLTGVGVKERVSISYKPGEVVTEERVLKAVQSMITQSNAENTEFEISGPRVIRIFETNVPALAQSRERKLNRRSQTHE